jgi:hypothetical protein
MQEVLTTLQYSILFLRSSSKLSFSANASSFGLLFSPGYGNDSISNLAEFISFASSSIVDIQLLLQSKNINSHPLSNVLKALADCESCLRLISEASLDMLFTHLEYFSENLDRLSGMSISSRSSSFRRYISTILSNIERNMQNAYKFYPAEGNFSAENIQKHLKYFKRKYQVDRANRVSI